MGRWFSLSSSFGSLLLSIFLGLLVWIVAANDDLVKRNNFPGFPGIPIELRNLPPGLIVTEGEEQRVMVDVVLHEERQNDLSADDLVAYVDMAGLGPGTHQMEVMVEPRALAPQFRLTARIPNRITLRLDEEITRTFPVEVEITDAGTIAPNYQVLTPTVSPISLTIRGPATDLGPVERVVARLELDSARGTVEAMIEPLLLTEEEQPVVSEALRLTTPEVIVTVPIEQKPGYRELIVRNVITGTSALADRGYWISRASTDPTLVLVVGQPAVVDALDGIIEAEPFDVSSLEEGLIVRERTLQLPEGVSTVYDDFVTVSVKIEPQTSSKTVLLMPQVAGLAAGMVVSGTVPARIDVLLQGPITELEALNLDDVQATLEVEGLAAGSHLIRPRITTPGTLRAESIIPEQVEVTIREGRESREVVVPIEAVPALPAGQVALIKPRVLTVTLDGPLLAMASLDLSTVRATLPTDALTEAEQVITPTLTVADAITVLSLSPPQVAARVVSEADLLVVTAPVQLINLGEGLRATLNSNVAILRVVGSGSTQALAASPALSVSVNVAGRGEGSYALRPLVTLPPGFRPGRHRARAACRFSLWQGPRGDARRGTRAALPGVSSRGSWPAPPPRSGGCALWSGRIGWRWPGGSAGTRRAARNVARARAPRARSNRSAPRSSPHAVGSPSPAPALPRYRRCPAPHPKGALSPPLARPERWQAASRGGGGTASPG